jgi:hypothetical protein
LDDDEQWRWPAGAALASRAIRKRITIALIACKWTTKVIGS